MLGLHWQGSGSVEYRTRSLAGRWSAWRAADADSGPDAGSAERSGPGWHDGNLDWVGASRGRPVPARPAASRGCAPTTSGRSRSACRAAPRRSPACPRSSRAPRWEADEKITRAKPRYAPTLKLAVVHHTAGSNTYTPAQAAAIVRGIEVYHVKGTAGTTSVTTSSSTASAPSTRAAAGGIDTNVIGAHSLGFNTGTVGVALIGNFTRATPPPAMQSALVRPARLAPRRRARRSALDQVVDTLGRQPQVQAGKVVTLRAISGHRDTGPSECPGNRDYALLPALTKRVALTGLPKLYSLAGDRRARRADPLPGPALLGAAVDGDGDHRRPARSSRRGSGRSTSSTGRGARRRRARGRSAGDRRGPEGLPGARARSADARRAPAPTPQPTPTPRRPRAGHARDAGAEARARRAGDLARDGPDRGAGDDQPGPDGTGIATTVDFTLAAAAQVTVTRDAEPAGVRRC